MCKVCFLCNAILEKILEMTRNLCAHPASLLNPTISKFCYPPIWKKFRTWFFQMLFNKSLIKCKKFVSCLMQSSKKFWKWPETYVLILHSYWPPQFLNSSCIVIITLYNSKIMLSLHYFLTPQFQTFTNLLIGIFGVSNPTYYYYYFFLRFLIN